MTFIKEDKTTWANTLFDATYAEGWIEETLDATGLHFERITWDYYDCSIELKEMELGTSITDEVKKLIWEMGFQKFWVTYTDGSELYFSKPVEGK